MATLTADQLAADRRRVQALVPIDQPKPVLNAAFQTVEDWFNANQAALSSAINAATAPVVLTVAQKKALVAVWLGQRMTRDGG